MNEAYKDTISVVKSEGLHKDVQNAHTKHLWSNMRDIIETAASKIKKKRVKPWMFY